MGLPPALARPRSIEPARLPPGASLAMPALSCPVLAPSRLFPAAFPTPARSFQALNFRFLPPAFSCALRFTSPNVPLRPFTTRLIAPLRLSGPPGKLTVVRGAAYGSNAGRRPTSVSFGAVTRTLKEPGPVTETQPRPAITTSYSLFFQDLPVIYMTQQQTPISRDRKQQEDLMVPHTDTRHSHPMEKHFAIEGR
jgi:hypothetical protein